jgi:hypothetical protein
MTDADKLVLVQAAISVWERSWAARDRIVEEAESAGQDVCWAAASMTPGSNNQVAGYSCQLRGAPPRMGTEAMPQIQGAFKGEEVIKEGAR